jgi:cytochrome b561
MPAIYAMILTRIKFYQLISKKKAIFVKINFVKLKYFLPAIMWALFILTISLVPASKIPSISILQLKYADKIIHFVMYFYFAALISMGFYLQIGYNLKRNYFISFIIPFFFASATEIMQRFLISDRSGDLYDMLANLAGIIAGVFIARVFSKTIVFEKLRKLFRKSES